MWFCEYGLNPTQNEICIGGNPTSVVCIMKFVIPNRLLKAIVKP